MSKYIIEVGDAYAEYVCGKGDMLCLPVRINEFEDNWLNTNIPLTPYTEPDTEKVREEAYEEGYSTAVAEQECAVRGAAEKAYQKGLSDAWEAARKIAIGEESRSLTCREMQRIFCTDETDEIFDMSASEVIEKIRQYEQEKEEQIQVGDEVGYYGVADEHGNMNYSGVVLEIREDDYLVMEKTGKTYPLKKKLVMSKTGRHFPEIAEVMQKMRGNN